MRTSAEKRWSPHLALRGPSRTGGFLSHSLPLGETHASAAVRAQEWVGERNEVRAFVRWAVVVAIGMVPPIALAEDLLPKRPGFNRYQAVLNRSFAIPSVVPTATSGLAKDLYIAEIAWRDKGCAVTVTLRSATDKDFKKELPAKRSGQTKCSDERDFSNIYLDLRP